MRAARYARQFKKDVRLAQKRRKDIDKLKKFIADLVEGHAIAEKHKDHALAGDFTGYRECHLEPDWLLIYKLSPSEIHFVRVGTHSDLFG